MPLSINCPGCREPLDVDDEYRAWKVRCPRCRHEFYPDDAAGPERYDDPPPTPRRGPRGGRRLSDDEVVDRARAVVAGPASWLRVFGVLGLLFGIAGVVGTVALGMWVADNPARARQQANAPNEEELIVNVVVLGVCSSFSVVFGGVMTYGAIRMGRLESHGWGVATAVMAIGSILYCTCGLFTGVPLGIWALVTLTKPEVKAGFDVVAGRRRQYHPARDDEDDDGD